jgi:uncharacterized protein (DUF2147 family)
MLLIVNFTAMKKYIFHILVPLFLTASAYCQSVRPDGVVGLWKSPDGRLAVKIDKIGKFYQGRIAWIDLELSEDKPLLDEKNPEPHLRNMPLKGNKMLSELSYNSHENTWDGGIYYDADEGKLYNCSIELVDNQRLRIKKFLQNPSKADKELWTKAR